MDIQVQEHLIRIYIIKISGRLEAFTVGQLREEQTRLLGSGAQNFIVDLSETVFIDSAGMAGLVSLLKQARQAGGNVALIKPVNAAAYRILTLTRFDQVFVMANTISTALKHF